MNTKWLTGLMLIVTLTATITFAAEPNQPAGKEPLIQMAILLDTSGSMDGLIDQARAQLWTIVNEYATARQNGKAPRLELALYEYGNDGLAAEKGHIRQILPLTTDLDKVSQELFALKTNGGNEYCGWVIKNAVADLTWSSTPETYKVIFIAGNEPFTQGEVDYKLSCKAAIEKGVIVNTIHCGDRSTGINEKWEDGAKLADGGYLTIDQNRQAIVIAAPQDNEILSLNNELNTTYLAYGAEGLHRVELQAEMDSSALSLSAPVAVQRAQAKASANYENSAWDMVDAANQNKLDLGKMKKEELPEAIREMTLPQQQEYIKQLAGKRAELQKQITSLNTQRQKFVAGEMKKLADKGENTLEAVIIKLVREQAARKQFIFAVPQTDKTNPTPPQPDAPAK